MSRLAPVPVPDLTGKSILVTGSGRGIGAELVRILAAHGGRVYAGVTANDPREPLQASALVLQLDGTSPSDIASAIARIAGDAGQLDALVNNAGVIDPIGHVDAISSDDLARAFAVNVVGAHRVIKAALPLLRVRGGAIVNAGTGAATTPLEGWTAYCASKAALQMLSRIMALELSDASIRTHFLGIPPTDTAMQGAIRSSGINPISRIPQSDLISCTIPASCMAWLCSDDAASVADVLLDVRSEPFTSMMLQARSGN